MLRKTLFLATAAVFAAGSVSAAELKWVGCGISKKAFMTALAKAYEKKTGTLINLQGGGATRGIRDVAAKKADMGGSCRHKILAHEETNTKLIPIGWDSIVVITNPANPVKKITSGQLKLLLLGKITNWKELGGPDAPVKLVIRKSKISGVGLMIRELLYHDPKIEFSPNAIKLKSSAPIEKFIEKETLAIGVTGISSGRKRKVSFLKLDGVEPTYDNVASGKYPLHRPLYLSVPKDNFSKVKNFVSFATSKEGQDIIKSQGTVNIQDGKTLWPRYRKKIHQARKKGRF